MWIITKHAGLINTQHVLRFYENSYGTHAYCGGASYLVSQDHVMATIIEALGNGVKYLEVE